MATAVMKNRYFIVPSDVHLVYANDSVTDFVPRIIPEMGAPVARILE
jgi:hypothetical protein